MTENEQIIPSSEEPVGGSENKSETSFKPSWLFESEDELKGLQLDPQTKFSRAISLLHKTPMSLLEGKMQDVALNLLNLATEEEISEDVYGFVIGKISRIIEEKLKQDSTSQTGEENPLQKLVEINRQILGISKEDTELQRLQLEMLRRSGFSGLVSAMDARAGINVQQFDTEVPVWYNELSEDWKNVVRTNLGILLGAYYKFRSPGKGAETIISSEDIRIDREALAFMWENMPGFRVVATTITSELFENNSSRLVLSEEGKRRLLNTAAYKRSLEERLTSYFENHGEILDLYSKTGGPRDLDPSLAAKFAVSSVFNLFYLGGAFESGDVGRDLKDPYVFNPSVRTFYLPRNQARSKYVLGEEDVVGTDEAWGGKLGEWFAERIRHDPNFKADFLENKGITRLIPDRLMYSIFELTYFNDGRSLASVLISASKNGMEGGLFDYGEQVNLRDLKYSELWGGYSDVMDSAWKIYQAIIGKADPKDFDRQALGNALSKLRKEKTLKEIYTGEKGEWILKAVITSLLGGPNLYSSEILLRLPEENYDYSVWFWLNDDRIFATLPSGARKRVFELLNAKDLDSFWHSLISSVQDLPLVGKRRKIRMEIISEQEKWR
ncbi:MAG: hypothetical protein KatS3mg088_125 [Patescibacteria group bacterium]|nr:MAG: hypothetical protein KatS3mg088_125 [Patescibacteria group bacterium]